MNKKFNKTITVEIDGEEYERTLLDTLKKDKTGRGFGIYTFIDLYGQQCSLQDSSLASESAIWFGVDVNLKGEKIGERMHLTQEQVKALLPILTYFAKTGEYIKDFKKEKK